MLNISYKNILRIALPVSLGAFVQFILVFTDNYFLGRLGMNTMNGAATVGLIYITFAILGVGLGGGTQIMVARRTGENNFAKAGTTVANSFFISILLAVVLFVILRFVCPVFFESWISSSEIMEVMHEFLNVRAWGVFFFIPTSVLNGFFIGISNPKILGISTGVAAFVNVLLCWILVFGNAGFESMGASGAAYASLIAEGIALLITIFYTFNSTHAKKFSLRAAFSRIPLAQTISIMKLSLPLMLQLLLSLSIWTVFFMFIEKLGEKQMQASHIIRSMYLLALISTMGFSQTTRTIVSTLMAENRTGEIRSALKKLMILNFIGVIVLAHGLVLYPYSVAALFTTDPETIEYAINCMYVVFPAMIIFTVSGILLNTVEGSGNTVAGFMIELGTTVFYFSFAWYVTIHHPMPVHVAWFADWIYFGCIGVLSWIYLRFSNWRFTQV